ncbi:MAG TPA: enoyl-CoA hydratase-related protein [Solirubrobacterales bacterium]|nr:enoyl-CoA hydratase-related protein [Solirubrobacterales bacterium]
MPGAREALFSPPTAADDDAAVASLLALRELLGEEDAIVVVHGAGERFLFGGPLVEAGTRRLLAEVCDRIEARRLPVLAACEGSVLDAGLELALACDLRFARPGVAVGLPDALAGGRPPQGAGQRLARLGGSSLATAALLLGETPRCGEDRRLDAVFELAADPLAAARAGAARLAASAPLVLEALKTSMRAAASLPLDAGLAIEADLACLLLESEDRAEGLRARAEGREPDFRGR